MSCVSVVSINVCGYFIYLYGCWVISSFFLSIHVSMAGVLYTMVSCVSSARQTVFNILLVTNRLLAVGFPMSELVLCWVVGSLSGGRISVFSSSSCWSSSASSATASPPPTTLGRLVAGGRSE